jgi:hypothetical protein
MAACGSGGETTDSASGRFGDQPSGAGGGGNPAHVRLSTDVAPLFKANCALSGCHDAEHREHGLDFSTAESVHASLVGQTTMDHCRDNMQVTRVVPGRPEESFVLVMVDGVDRCAGSPRMPPSPRAPLSADQVQVIRSWIAAGAPLD